MTAFMTAVQIAAFLAIIVGWLRGGPPERFGAGVMLISYLSSTQIHSWHIGNFHWATAMKALALVLIFGWMAFRGGRWWPLIMTAALALTVLVHGLSLLDPALPHDAAVSAHIGLWIVIYLTLLAGVGERWLAGERAVSGAALWRGRRRAS